jgi:hypothetical protein
VLSSIFARLSCTLRIDAILFRRWAGSSFSALTGCGCGCWPPPLDPAEVAEIAEAGRFFNTEPAPAPLPEPAGFGFTMVVEVGMVFL